MKTEANKSAVYYCALVLLFSLPRFNNQKNDTQLNTVQSF